MQKNKGQAMVGVVAVIAILALVVSAAALFSRKPLGSGQSTEFTNPEIFWNTVALKGVVTGSAASSTFSGNFVVGGNATGTTGLILHSATAGLCYQVTLTAQGAFATSSAGCN